MKRIVLVSIFIVLASMSHAQITIDGIGLEDPNHLSVCGDLVVNNQPSLESPIILDPYLSQSNHFSRFIPASGITSSGIFSLPDRREFAYVHSEWLNFSNTFNSSLSLQFMTMSPGANPTDSFRCARLIDGTEGYSTVLVQHSPHTVSVPESHYSIEHPNDDPTTVSVMTIPVTTDPDSTYLTFSTQEWLKVIGDPIRTGSTNLELEIHHRVVTPTTTDGLLIINEHLIEFEYRLPVSGEIVYCSGRIDEFNIVGRYGGTFTEFAINRYDEQRQGQGGVLA